MTEEQYQQVISLDNKLKELKRVYHILDNNDTSIFSKEEIELQEQLLKSDFYSQIAATNHSWDSQHLKNNLSKSSD